MIDIYTVVKRGFGDPVEKRKALKVTNATVVFENGRRENLSSDHCSHFTTLDEAIEFFNQFHSQRRLLLESELKSLDKRADDFFDFVWKERGYK